MEHIIGSGCVSVDPDRYITPLSHCACSICTNVMSIIVCTVILV